MRIITKLLTLFALGMCAGAMSAQVHPPINTPIFRSFDANGKPLVGGLLYSYGAGSSTPLATFADAGAVTPNTNPVVLDSTGSAKVFLGASNYKFVLQDANGVQQWSIDNINGAPPLSSVVTVFGRSGAIVALNGDYTCSQITGAICSLPTQYYQTVSADGAVQTQRPKLNLISGTGALVTCADNATTMATDCTIAPSGTPPTPTTCNVNGCYRIDGVGTIEQWGTATSCGSGANGCTVSVTFPYPFTTTGMSIQATVQNTTANVLATVGSLPSTTSFNLQYAALVFVGGVGNNLSGTQTALWHAIGK